MTRNASQTLGFRFFQGYKQDSGNVMHPNLKKLSKRNILLRQHQFFEHLTSYNQTETDDWIQEMFERQESESDTFVHVLVQLWPIKIYIETINSSS